MLNKPSRLLSVCLSCATAEQRSSWVTAWLLTSYSTEGGGVRERLANSWLTTLFCCTRHTALRFHFLMECWAEMTLPLQCSPVGRPWNRSALLLLVRRQTTSSDLLHLLTCHEPETVVQTPDSLSSSSAEILHFLSVGRPGAQDVGKQSLGSPQTGGSHSSLSPWVK